MPLLLRTECAYLVSDSHMWGNTGHTSPKGEKRRRRRKLVSRTFGVWKKSCKKGTFFIFLKTFGELVLLQLFDGNFRYTLLFRVPDRNFLPRNFLNDVEKGP